MYSTIAVFRALQLGDMLCVIPACRALRHAFPQAHIALIGLPWANDLIYRFPAYFDEFIAFPGYPGLPEQPVNARATDAFCDAIRQRKFDLLLQMHGNGSIVNPFMETLGARVTGGFCRQEEYGPYPDTYLEYPEDEHEINRHLLLMRHLGIPTQGAHLEFPYATMIKLPSRPYICVHPASRCAARQWRPRYFAALADHFAAIGYTIVLTGTAGERKVAAEVAARMEYRSMNLAGQTSLDGVAALLQQAAALFSNSTGVSQIAAALETPSVIISMDGEPHRRAPLNKRLHRTIDWTVIPDYNAVLNEAAALLASERVPGQLRC